MRAHASQLIVLAACAFALHTPVLAASADAAAIDASIASPSRSTSDREQDTWRKPEVVLAFLGARPGMQVIDYFAADGYYSELLSRVVGSKGKVTVYNNAGYAGFAGKKLTERFAAKRLPNTEQLVVETAALNLADNSLDAALFVMAWHDLYFIPEKASAPMGDPKQVASLLFRALKPGGVVVIQDHAARAGADPLTSVQKLHRIDPELVKRALTGAGFRFDAESPAFKHPDDDHSKPVFDPAVRHRSDQFIYRFVKP
jgi:predicted methyltransferase